MRISDWSSDVCSSDLPPPRQPAGAAAPLKTKDGSTEVRRRLQTTNDRRGPGRSPRRRSAVAKPSPVDPSPSTGGQAPMVDPADARRPSREPETVDDIAARTGDRKGHL